MTKKDDTPKIYGADPRAIVSTQGEALTDTKVDKAQALETLAETVATTVTELSGEPAAVLLVTWNPEAPDLVTNMVTNAPHDQHVAVVYKYAQEFFSAGRGNTEGEANDDTPPKGETH